MGLCQYSEIFYTYAAVLRLLLFFPGLRVSVSQIIVPNVCSRLKFCLQVAIPDVGVKCVNFVNLASEHSIANGEERERERQGDKKKRRKCSWWLALGEY